MYTHPHHSALHHRKLKHKQNFLLAILVPALILSLVWYFTGANANELVFGVLASIARLFLAYLFCVALAYPLAIFATKNPSREKALIPIFDVLESFPGLAVLSVLITIFGRSEAVTIIVLLIDMMWPLLFTLISGLKTVNSELGEAARLYGATGWKYLYYFVLPATLPALITGSIVSFGQGWQILVGAELIGTASGIGSFIVSATNNGNNSLVIAGFATLLVAVFIINRFIWVPLLTSASKYQSE